MHRRRCGAWGYNYYGQLGNDSQTTSQVPVAVAGLGALRGKTVVAVAAGETHCLALCSDGSVVAWGATPPVSLAMAVP